MKKILPYIFLTVLLASCSEPFDLDTRNGDKTYLCVEAILTNVPSVQTIRLSESIPYSSKDSAPAVTGATVSVTDGKDIFVFNERKEKAGSYDSAPGFHCEKGKKYTLNVECKFSGGTAGHFEAESIMPDDGFDIEKVDYKHLGEAKDSTWVLGVWGKDRPETSYFLITTAINGIMSPTTSMLDRAMLMPDTYFNSSTIKGFPIGYLYQYAEQYKKYGECAKVPRKGDILSLVVYTMPKDYYDFVMALGGASGATSIPIIASQPANLPTNIKGGNAMGYFTTSPVMVASCVVDDPMRKDFKY